MMNHQQQVSCLLTHAAAGSAAGVAVNAAANTTLKVTALRDATWNVPSAGAAQSAERAHIVRLKAKDGSVTGIQLRTGRGAGASEHFAVKKHGGERKALQAACEAAARRGLTLGNSRGGSAVGRLTARSRTGEPGIRFEWQEFSHSIVLYVVVTYTDKKGTNRESKRSTATHGLEGALDHAIKVRRNAGAPTPNRHALLQALQAEYKTGARQRYLTRWPGSAKPV